MAAAPNQTGSTLNSPVSSSLGYGQDLADQVAAQAEERRKKALSLSGTSAPGTGPVSGMLGMS
jgi:hypothetical protein